MHSTILSILCDIKQKLKHPATLLIILVFILFLLNMIEINKFSFETRPEVLIKNRTYFIDLEGCQIPYFKPVHKSIEKYIVEPHEIKCKAKEAIVYSIPNKYQIYVNESALKSWDLKTTDLDCCYKSFKRDESKKGDFNVKYSENCINFNGNATVNDEFIRVECSKINDSNVIYKDFFSFIVNKNFKLNNIFDKQNNFRNKKKMNILMIGIDAVSRLNLYRSLPKTVDYLLNDANANEFVGYNKVGDNTFPNLVPILTGWSETELQEKCLNNSFDNYLDPCPWIWKKYKANNYLTLYAEESTEMGLFTYDRKGFKKQSTDYDYRIFDREASKTIGNIKDWNSNICLGSRLRFTTILNYAKTFTNTVFNHPFFSLFWTVSLSHDYLEQPKLTDSDFLNFFKDYFETNSISNSTILIFLSDHGLRWGDLRQTIQGKYEERLPFLFFRFPKWFKIFYKKAYDNFLINLNRLTTPFDLHETLNELLNLEQIENSAIIKRLDEPYMKRGISLFLPIPTNRTCENAGIPEHFCTCQKSTQLDTNDGLSKEIALFLVDYINSLLVGFKECAKLNIKSIESLTKNEHLEHLNEDVKDSSIDYTITLYTKPGNGLFEGTVRKQTDNNTFVPSGTISRLNLYGSDSRCMTDFHLKLYCYCV